MCKTDFIKFVDKFQYFQYCVLLFILTSTQQGLTFHFGLSRKRDEQKTKNRVHHEIYEENSKTQKKKTKYMHTEKI